MSSTTSSDQDPQTSQHHLQHSLSTISLLDEVPVSPIPFQVPNTTPETGQPPPTRTVSLPSPPIDPASFFIPRLIANFLPEGTITLDRNAFVKRPVIQGKEMKCKIHRKRDTMNDRLYPCYELYLQDEHNDNILHFLMSARKKSKTGGKSLYHISLVRSEEVSETDEFVARVKSNYIGTTFVIDGVGKSFNKPLKNPGMEYRSEYGCVIYDPNILGFKGPRKMTILLPGMTNTRTRIPFKPTSTTETLLSKYKSQPPNQQQEILCLHNKSPQWNEETQSFVLNFNGRVTLASVKNFQIVHDNDLDYICLQFGRISEDSFTCDFKYPFCPVQAFGIALSSFDAKLACE